MQLVCSRQAGACLASCLTLALLWSASAEARSEELPELEGILPEASMCWSGMPQDCRGKAGRLEPEFTSRQSFIAADIERVQALARSQAGPSRS